MLMQVDICDIIGNEVMTPFQNSGESCSVQSLVPMNGTELIKSFNKQSHLFEDNHALELALREVGY